MSRLSVWFATLVTTTVKDAWERKGEIHLAPNCISRGRMGRVNPILSTIIAKDAS